MSPTPQPDGSSTINPELARRTDSVVERLADELVAASHAIHGHPELNYEEHFAHDLLVSTLERHGLEVEAHACGLDTAFVARAGSSGPTIAILCEYDALPEIGHACGHNIIATAGLGAGLALAAVIEELGGRVVIMGTPAEEGGGGKVKMARAGAFEGVDAALMIHPAGVDLTRMTTIAIHEMWVQYDGEAAHAAAAPWKGRNALDAAVLGYNNVAALRQHIRPDERIHGIFTKAGDKPNIVPKHTEANWYVRSPTARTLEILKPRVLACLQAGADASGCQMHHQWADVAYSDMIDNSSILSHYRDHAAALGRSVADPDAAHAVVGSTDMGNVSYLTPSIHPMIAVAPANVSIHTPEFATYARSESGDRAVVDGARLLARLGAELITDAGFLAAATAEFQGELARRQ
jgi:amidohydrolase